jgi:hypothetical protein
MEKRNGVKRMRVTSNEITYHTIINQVFFADGSELIITTGYPEGQEADLDRSLEWATGKAPKWARDLEDKDILKMVGKMEEAND